MRFRTWPVAALGLAGLLALIVFSLYTAYDRALGASGQLDALNVRHRAIFGKLRQVRSDVLLSAIFVRDYLLDDRDRDRKYREELAAFRESSLRALTELSGLFPESNGLPATNQLRSSLESYWKLLEPLFTWTPAEKEARSLAFLRTDVLKRREEVLALARDIEALNDATFDNQRAGIVSRRVEYQQGLLSLLWQSLILGTIVSVVAVNRLRVLERRADEQRAFAEAAEQRMRALSQQIVATQEEERRKLSRELHDHVGQLLTGLRMELGRIERAAVDRLGPAMADSRSIVDDLTRIVRDLASGLRPSMLDDLGLQPALEWLGRDVSRRCGLPVSVSVETGLDTLPDTHRTCVYRVVQEALTNIVRHANATRVDVSVRSQGFALVIRVVDDGTGFIADQRAAGVGLRGLEERVKELSGSVQIDSAPGAGTAVVVHLPVQMGVHAARLAG